MKMSPANFSMLDFESWALGPVGFHEDMLVGDRILHTRRRFSRQLWIMSLGLFKAQILTTLFSFSLIVAKLMRIMSWTCMLLSFWWWSSGFNPPVCDKTSFTLCNKTRKDRAGWKSDKVRFWHQLTQAQVCVTRQDSSGSYGLGFMKPNYARSLVIRILLERCMVKIMSMTMLIWMTITPMLKPELLQFNNFWQSGTSNSNFMMVNNFIIYYTYVGKNAL